MELKEVFLNHKGRVAHKLVHYLPIYERHFSRFVGKRIRLLEIGVSHGGSLEIWRKYFGPESVIVGIDINDHCKNYESDGIHIRIGSQSDIQFLRELVDEFGKFDIVIDDGSHIMSDIKQSFDYLYPQIDGNGVYLVEDLCCAYWAQYEGGLRREGTFIEFAKEKIDDLNGKHWGQGKSPDLYSKLTSSMSFYDSVVVFERGDSDNFSRMKYGK